MDTRCFLRVGQGELKMSKEDNYSIYIVVSQTNTVLGKLIQRQLGVRFNHCSVSLDDSLNHIFSFGRKELHNVFRAGFVRESKADGFFAEYKRSYIAVLQIPVTKKQWEQAKDCLLRFKQQGNQYKYSVLGLVYCYLGIPIKRKNKYFCSQFVAEFLRESGLCLFDKDESLICPHDFLKISIGEVIYTGEIGKYDVA